MKTYLSYFQEFCHSVHSNKKFLVQIQGISTLLLVHVKVFFYKEQIYDDLTKEISCN